MRKLVLTLQMEMPTEITIGEAVLRAGLKLKQITNEERIVAGADGTYAIIRSDAIVTAKFTEGKHEE